MKVFSLVYMILSPLLILFLAYQNYQLKQMVNRPVVADQRQVVPPADAPLLGSPDAPVSLVVFSNFACTYCADAAHVLNHLLEEYPEEVSVSYRHMITGEGGMGTALLASAAGEQGFFWEMHDVLFAGMPDFGKLDYAKLIPGLDEAQLREDLMREDLQKRIDEDNRTAATLGVEGTPTVFVNGIEVSGVRYETLKALILKELGRLNADRS
ncbi:MAG: thioredoxin domain-containing protein [Acidobacteriota bacterium]|nr:thioredoxin domain-containing protein [Acidobacteriota bacterium]